ncbi:MAG: ANTAR domain-containing protein [Acidimicrobiales bacterium]
MGEATLEDALREVAEMLVADAPFASTLQRLAELGCELGTAAVAVDIELVDQRGRAADRAQVGTPPATGARLSVPLTTGRNPLGTLTVHAGSAEPFSDGDADAVTRFARQASVVLANARAYWEVHEVASGLQAAMQSRAVIEQAKGTIMATERCTADEAFALLARASQRENVKLRDLARRVLEEGPAALVSR